VAEALARARPRLGAFGAEVHYFPTVGSTNDVALALASAGARTGVVVLADEQSSGRGRRGRTWFSPPGTGLYVSVVLAAPAASPADRASSLLTLAIGVALAEGIEAATGLAPAIKWPNDLTIGRRKVAGILTEAASGSDRADAPASAVVTGFGINVGPLSCPPELVDRATSLETELGRSVDRAQLLAELLASVAARYADLLEGRCDAVLETWRARAPAARGAAVRWVTASGPLAGITAGIADDGALLVRIGSRVERIVAGEVRWE
jgi:BirA family transcriptional regulator, biotin operon repressor / biotin---[acetyl-CoA-carboxylase] ligase